VDSLRGATQKEQDAIRAELDAHIEDHICDLIDLGYSEKLAEERTMLRMGDPEEVGRELDKQYPMRWLVIGDISAFVAVAIIFLFIMAQLVGFFEESVVRSVYYRFQPESIECLECIDAAEETDIRFELNDDILRVFQVSVGEMRGKHVAVVEVQCFDRIPGGPVGDWMSWTTIESQRGEKGQSYDNARTWIISRIGGSWLRQRCLWVPVEENDTYVTLRCEKYGQKVDYQIPLPEEGGI